MKRGSVLVVDDQMSLAENIAEILQGIGFQTDIAGSAEQALARVAQGGITAVVTDFKLPGASGAQLIEDLRRRGERMPVLMMSAYTDEGTIGQSRAAGAWLFLPKPVPLSTLIDAFESLARQPATALVVDDEESLAHNLAEALTAAGHEVVVTHSAAEALAQNRRVQTAVLDVRLPDGTGVDVARQLRARDPDIQILFISGYAEWLEPQSRAEVPDAEALEKPFDPGRVLSWVQVAVARSSRS
ncbi:MAG TPA: response regulator [Polyangia bacterium]|nr:response regulator [Polyangia bacterium]